MKGSGADPAMLRALYERSLCDFRRVAAAVVGSVDDGEDVVQDAFAKALARRRQYRGESSLEAWVWQIVLNEAKSQSQRRKRRWRRLEADRAGGVRPRDDERSAVRDALAQLPERERLAVFLRYFADLDYAQIAAVLDVQTGTVGASLSSGRARLGRLLVEGDGR